MKVPMVLIKMSEEGDIEQVICDMPVLVLYERPGCRGRTKVVDPDDVSEEDANHYRLTKSIWRDVVEEQTPPTEAKVWTEDAPYHPLINKRP